MNLKTSIISAQALLKEHTYPYCKKLKIDPDSIGLIHKDDFNIKIALTGPREIIKTNVSGSFQESGANYTKISAVLKLSAETISFIGIFNFSLLIIILCCCFFEITKIYIPIIIFILVNSLFILFIRCNFNTTKHLITRIFDNLIDTNDNPEDNSMS